MRILLLIPAFNEERTIRQVVKGCLNHVENVLVVDDGSTDRTADQAERAAARIIRLPENRGKGHALKAGFRFAIDQGYDWVITMDGDAQHDPEDLPACLGALNGLDLLLGNRMTDTSSMPLLRRFANRLSTWLVSRAAGIRIHDSQTGFRAYSRRLLERLELRSGGYDLESEVIIAAARSGLRVGQFPIRTVYAGETSRFRTFRDSARFFATVLRSIRRTRGQGSAR